MLEGRTANRESSRLDRNVQIMGEIYDLGWQGLPTRRRG